MATNEAYFMHYVNADGDTLEFWSAQYLLLLDGITDGRLHDAALVAWSRLEFEGITIEGR